MYIYFDKYCELKFKYLNVEYNYILIIINTIKGTIKKKSYVGWFACRCHLNYCLTSNS